MCLDIIFHLFPYISKPSKKASCSASVHRPVRSVSVSVSHCLPVVLITFGNLTVFLPVAFVTFGNIVGGVLAVDKELE